MMKKKAVSEEDDGEESEEESEDDRKKAKKKKKKKKGGGGRKKRPEPVPVYLPPTKEMVTLFQERPKKPVKKKDIDQETAAEKLRREALEGLDDYRTAPFEIDPTIPEAPVGLVRSRNYFEGHSEKLCRRFLTMGPDIAKKTMFLAQGNVSVLLFSFVVFSLYGL